MTRYPMSRGIALVMVLWSGMVCIGCASDFGKAPAQVIDGCHIYSRALGYWTLEAPGGWACAQIEPFGQAWRVYYPWLDVPESHWQTLTEAEDAAGKICKR